MITNNNIIMGKNFEECKNTKLYTKEELEKARLYAIRDLRDEVQRDLNKLFKKYTQNFDELQDKLLGDEE